jgi:DHA1 family bicyclomycin/chloramphenicol resistance-like MFS transporter
MSASGGTAEGGSTLRQGPEAGDEASVGAPSAEPRPGPTVSAADPAERHAPRSDRAFVAMIAACMAMVGLAIDTVLPAFPEIREDFGLAPDSTQVTWIITAFFLGLASGQLVYGPLSDRYGRKPLLYCGLGLCAVSASASALAPSLGLVIVFRFLWGFGAAGPRSLALAMVRDTYEGDRMARAMSFAMSIFVLSPVFAPTVGAVLVAVTAWQAVFWFLVLCTLGVGAWALRMPETLPPSRRRPAEPGALRRAVSVVLRTRPTMAYGLAVTFLFGSMAAYLASSEIIIDDVYDRKSQFPLIFGALAIFMGLASLTNARLVMRFGLSRVLKVGACCLITATALFALLVLSTDGAPPFWTYCVSMALLLPMHTLLLPNCNTAAMGPVGQVAGTAAALLGTASTGGGALLGSVVDSRFDGTVTPLALGFVAFGSVAAFSIMVLARPSGRRVVAAGAAAPATT